MLSSTLINSESFFWFCAWVGSGLFSIQLLLSFLGGGIFDEDNQGLESTQFKWLSRHAITGFLMMFGWTGITCQKEWLLSSGATLSLSIGAGLFTMLLTATIFHFAKKLQSSGNVFNIEALVGKEALTYTRIPKESVGKISISFLESTFEIDAVSADQKEIASFTRVHVLKKLDDNTVVVKTLTRE